MYIKSEELKIDEINYKSLLAIFQAFSLNGQELYLVGGCVRDLLLGKNPKDYDLCTNATPDEVKQKEYKKRRFLRTF